MRTKAEAIEVIQKLLARTIERGCTPAEAAFAAERAQEMLAEYQLSAFDVATNTLDDSVTDKRRNLPGSNIPKWSWRIAAEIAAAFDCKLVARYGGSEIGGKYVKQNSFSFIGVSGDAETAAFFYDQLSPLVFEQSGKAAKLAGASGVGEIASFRYSFAAGFGEAIRRRLKPTEAEQSTAPAGDTKSTALVVAKKEMVKAWCDANLGDTKTVKTAKPINVDGYGAGQRFGKSVELSRGIGASSGGKNNQIEG